MQESRAQRDISVSKQRPTQSRSVGPSISDAVAAHRFPTDWRLTVRRAAREKCKPDALVQWRGRSAVGHEETNSPQSFLVRCTSVNGLSSGRTDGLLSAITGNSVGLPVHW